MFPFFLQFTLVPMCVMKSTPACHLKGKKKTIIEATGEVIMFVDCLKKLKSFLSRGGGGVRAVILGFNVTFNS